MHEAFPCSARGPQPSSAKSCIKTASCYHPPGLSLDSVIWDNAFSLSCAWYISQYPEPRSSWLEDNGQITKCVLDDPASSGNSAVVVWILGCISRYHLKYSFGMYVRTGTHPHLLENTTNVPIIVWQVAVCKITF